MAGAAVFMVHAIMGNAMPELTAVEAGQQTGSIPA
jgi:hypothetical protein